VDQATRLGHPLSVTPTYARMSTVCSGRDGGGVDLGGHSPPQGASPAHDWRVSAVFEDLGFEDATDLRPGDLQWLDEAPVLMGPPHDSTEAEATQAVLLPPHEATHSVTWSPRIGRTPDPATNVAVRKASSVSVSATAASLS